MLNNVIQPVPIENILPFENSFSIKIPAPYKLKYLVFCKKATFH